MALTQVQSGMLNSDSQNYGFKNRIINGDMRIDQRNNGASVNINPDGYTLDRWKAFASGTAKFSVQQNAGSVTPPAGFANYLGITSLAATSVGSTDYFLIRQHIEGYNLADLAWGTASAQAITMSFWVRASVTGVFGGSLQNNGGGRTYPFTYSISASNTWEYKTIVIPGDTSGTWLTTNGIGVQISWSIGMGSTYSGAAGSWSSGNYNSATGSTNLISTNGATFYITGVQFEKGSVATEFDRRPYTTELQLCQRYYVQFGTTSAYEHFGIGVVQSGQTTTIINLPVTMRGAPTFAYVSGSLSNFVIYDGTVAAAPSSMTIDVAGPSICSLAIPASGLTIGRATRFYRSASAQATITFSAEL